MKKYAIISDEKTGLCQVGVGTNTEFYKSIGMTEQDVEQSDVNGQWYLSSKCPHLSDKEKLNKAQDKKHTELKSVMTSKRQALTVSYDADTFDANKDAQANMIVLLKSFDLGATSVSIRSTTEQTHTFNKEHTQELSMLMLQAVNNLYSKYWEYKDALYNCKTIEEVEAISWKE